MVKRLKRLVLDLEGNGLEPTVIWCVATKDIDTGETRSFNIRDPEYLTKLKEYISDATEVIGHNLIGYDLGVLDRLAGIRVPIGSVTDTLVLSRLFNPIREGGHGLETWGFKLKLAKPEHNEWDKFSDAMMLRCETDVEINARLYTYLLNEGRRWSKRSIRLEHNVAYVLQKTKEAGCFFNQERATRLYQETYAKATELAAQITSQFCRLPKPYTAQPCHCVVMPKAKSDGSLSVVGLKWFPDWNKVCSPGAPFSRLKYQEFSLNSPAQIVDRMNRAGWRPTIFTKAGTPKVAEENFDSLPDNAPAEAKMIRDYLMLTSRHKTLETWLKFVKPDNRIHGDIIHIGTITHRCGHRNPNTGNIVGVKDKHGKVAPYGEELRALWGVADPVNRRFVGVDAKGIQLRILAHLMGDPEYTKIVVDGDPHQYLADKVGITRGQAKRLIYAWLLGAQATKVGTIIERSKEEGQKVMDRLLKDIPALGKMKLVMKEYAHRGWFACVDGRYVPIKSEHYALAVALQSIEAVVMKQALIYSWNEVKQLKLDAFPTLFVHDEFQWDCAKDCAEQVGRLIAENIRKAGESFKLRCPMAGDFRVGTNWAATH